MALTKRICQGLVSLTLIFQALAHYVGTDTVNPQKILTRDCDSGYSVMCFKLDIVSFIEKFSESKEYDILPGLSVIREMNNTDQKTAEIVAEMARNFPNDAEKRLDGFLLAKLSNFVKSHSLRVKLFDDNNVTVQDSQSEGRKKKKGIGVEMLAAGMMMKGTLMALALGALALLAGKALLTALMALMLAAIAALKSLASGGGKSTTYEIIAKPVYATTHSHSVSHEDVHGGHSGGGGGGGGGGSSGGGHSGYGGYGRSLNFELPAHLTKDE